MALGLPSNRSTSSTRTRRGGSCLKDIYKTFLIYRTCMRRAPAKPVRACTLRKWCLVSHVTFEAPLHTSQLTVFTLHSPHFTLHSSHCTLRSQHFTSHCALKTPHFTLHTALFTPFLTALFTLQTSHFTLHTALFTPHTSHCTLHTPHFISSELFSPYPSSNLLRSSWLFSCHLSAAQTCSCVGPTFNFSKVERNSCRFFYMPKGVDHKIFTILRSLMPSVDALHQIATASVNMV